MNKKQKTWFGISIILLIIVGLIISVVLIGSGKNKEEEQPDIAIDTSEQTSSSIIGDEIMEVQPDVSESTSTIPEEPTPTEVEEEEIKEKEFQEEYIEQENVERQEMSEEDVKARDLMAQEYAAEYSSTEVQPPFDSMLDRIRQEYDKVAWDDVYLTKGNFIWWLENEAKTKVDTPYTINILPYKGLVNIYVAGNEEQTEKVKDKLEKWVGSMLYASAYNETDVEFKVKFFAEN